MNHNYSRVLEEAEDTDISQTRRRSPESVDLYAWGGAAYRRRICKLRAGMHTHAPRINYKTMPL